MFFSTGIQHVCRYPFSVKFSLKNLGNLANIWEHAPLSHRLEPTLQRYQGRIQGGGAGGPPKPQVFFTHPPVDEMMIIMILPYNVSLYGLVFSLRKWFSQPHDITFFGLLGALPSPRPIASAPPKPKSWIRPLKVLVFYREPNDVFVVAVYVAFVVLPHSIHYMCHDLLHLSFTFSEVPFAS